MVREERASASIELAIGAVAILAVAGVAFDLYSLTRANAAGERIAATMADYVSQEAEPNGDEMAALGKFLHERELSMPSALVYVISAVHQPAGEKPAEELWDDKIRFGEADDTTALARECKNRGKSGWRMGLLGEDAALTLSAHDVVIVVEICASLQREGMLSEMVAGNLYRVHALPTRGIGGKPAAPSHSSASEDAAASTSKSSWPTAALHDRSNLSVRHAASESALSVTLGEIA